MGHMADDNYYNYGQQAYASSSCAQPVVEPVPVAGCWSQTMSGHSTVVQQPSYPVQQSHSYTVQPQPTYSAPTQPSYGYKVPHSGTSHQQTTYTTGGYGSHVGTVHHQGVGHQPLRGYYGMPHGKKRSNFYVQGYAGANLQNSLDVDGTSGAFTTGNIGDGTTIDVADGTEYGWETEFDTGSVLGAEIGYKMHNGFRFGLEATRSEAGVELHEDVTLGGADIGALDGAALVGDAVPLGTTVNEFLADGQGDIEQRGVFLNGYYDFNNGGRFRPYVGAGVGMVDVDIDYAPSGSQIIDGGETVLGYQGRVGASYNVTGPIDVFGEYTYRATDAIETENVLFTGNQEIKNKQSLVTVGARYNF